MTRNTNGEKGTALGFWRAGISIGSIVRQEPVITCKTGRGILGLESAGYDGRTGFVVDME
jgi:hypothetical protein